MAPKYGENNSNSAIAPFGLVPCRPVRFSAKIHPENLTLPSDLLHQKLAARNLELLGLMSLRSQTTVYTCHERVEGARDDALSSQLLKIAFRPKSRPVQCTASVWLGVR